MKIYQLIIIMMFISISKNAFSKTDGCSSYSVDTIIYSGKNVKIKKILILGNSITYHSKDLKVGWSGDWGMAASSPDSDYVHLLKKKFLQYDSTISLNVGGIANTFERKFWNMNQSDFTKFKAYNADLIILKIGENINDSLVKSNPQEFERDLELLVQNIKSKSDANVCIAASFWPNKFIDTSIEKICAKNNWLFVGLSDLSKEKNKNTAEKMFTNKGVGAHPSDEGMRKIANRIWNKIGFIFF